MFNFHLPVAFLLVLVASPAAICRARNGRAISTAPNGLIWKCKIPGSDILNELITHGHQYGVEIISTRLHTIHVHTAVHTSTSSLDDIGLKECTQLANLTDLFRTELSQNWHKLQYYTLDETFDVADLHKASRVSRQSEEYDKECVLNGKCDGKEDQWFNEYHDVDEIYTWFEDLATSHSDYVTVNQSIGKTYYGMDIMAVHITDKSVTSDHKVKIYFQCLLHAREWISGPVCMYIARYFANPDTTSIELMKQVEFIIVPVANPGGYQQTWVEYPKYRLWRKNMAPTNNPACDGVDLNRNFDAHWSLIGASDDECSELYHGAEAGSELEVQAITNYIQSNAPIVASIDFHSYSQEILFPPAWKNEDVSNVDSMQYLAGWMAYAASQVGARYTSQSMHSIYLASGTFPDWMLEQSVEGQDNINCSPVAFTIELRPQELHEKLFFGFMVPTEQIIATCEEMIAAIVKFSQLVVDKYSSCKIQNAYM